MNQTIFNLTYLLTKPHAIEHPFCHMGHKVKMTSMTINDYESVAKLIGKRRVNLGRRARLLRPELKRVLVLKTLPYSVEKNPARQILLSSVNAKVMTQVQQAPPLNLPHRLNTLTRHVRTKERTLFTICFCVSLLI